MSRIPDTDRRYLLRVLRADQAKRAEAIRRLSSTGLSPTSVELLIDAEERREDRALLVGLLEETAR